MEARQYITSGEAQGTQLVSEGSNGERIDFDVLLANQLISQEDENVIDTNISNRVLGTH